MNFCWFIKMVQSQLFRAPWELYGLPHRSKTLPEIIQLGRFLQVGVKMVATFQDSGWKNSFFLGIWQWRKKTSFLRDVFLGEKMQKNKLPYIDNISNIHIFEQSCFPLVFYSSNCQNQWNKTAADCAWGGASDVFRIWPNEHTPNQDTFTNHSLPSWLFQIVVFTCWIERWEMGSEQHLFCRMKPPSVVRSTIFEHPNSWKAAYFSVGNSAFCFSIWRHTHFPAILEIVAEHIETAECANWPLGCISQGPNLWETYVLSSTWGKTVKVEQCTGSFLALGGLNSARLLESDAETVWLTRMICQNPRPCQNLSKDVFLLGYVLDVLFLDMFFWGTSFGVTHRLSNLSVPLKNCHVSYMSGMHEICHYIYFRRLWEGRKTRIAADYSENKLFRFQNRKKQPFSKNQALPS